VKQSNAALSCPLSSHEVVLAALLLADLAELLSVGMIIWADRLCIKTYLIPIFILQDHLVFFFWYCFMTY
jgi:hypothetical protein